MGAPHLRLLRGLRDRGTRVLEAIPPCTLAARPSVREAVHAGLFPPSLGGAGPAEGARAVRLPGLKVHLAVRRCRQRPSMARGALDFRQSSFRHVTRVSLSNSVSVFSPCSALSAGSCPLALAGSGKPLPQGSPLHPSHLRWGCCMNYCGAPDAGGSQRPVFSAKYPPVHAPGKGLQSLVGAPLPGDVRGRSGH